MGTVILDMSMSLDGFAAGPNGEDMGLNDWFFSPAGRSREIIEESIASTGAIVMGRRANGVGDDAGIRLFDQADGQLALEPTRLVEAPDATHLRYRVVR